MRHEEALKHLDELDARRDYGLALRLHLRRCPDCARAAALAAAAAAAYRADGRVADSVGAAQAAGAASRVEDRVMAAVRLMPPPRQDFALRDWLLPAAMIAVSMFLELLFGPSYALALSLVLGIALTAYSALFIATHLAELQGYLEKRGLMPR